MDANGFCPIFSIFYAVFHPTEGSKVLCQVPSGSVVPPINKDSSTLPAPYFQFDWVKNYVIPKPQLCNRLVSCKVGNYRIVGHPICITGSEYERNSFVFNFAFVFPGEEDSTVYELPIRRLARMLMALEEQNKFLSQTSSLDKINSIIDQIYQDLNNYSECMIPIDESNLVNIKLFPLYPSPPDLKSYHVPITTVQLNRLMDENWDPTMEKIVPYINGINSISHIAELADANYSLAKQCIQHLIYYRCIVIVDLFQFSNIYASTSNISEFLSNPNMFKECQAYVYRISDGSPRKNSAAQLATSYSSTSSYSTIMNYHKPPSQVTLFYLYKSLHQGQTVREWYQEHRKLLNGIDVRRFLSFGVIKGLIYRVQSYPVAESETRRVHQQQHSGYLNPHYSETDPLHKLAQAPRHLDSICTESRKSKVEVEEMLKEDGDWSIVNS